MGSKFPGKSPFTLRTPESAAERGAEGADGSCGGGLVGEGGVALPPRAGLPSPAAHWRPQVRKHRPWRTSAPGGAYEARAHQCRGRRPWRCGSAGSRAVPVGQGITVSRATRMSFQTSRTRERMTAAPAGLPHIVLCPLRKTISAFHSVELMPEFIDHLTADGRRAVQDWGSSKASDDELAKVMEVDETRGETLGAGGAPQYVRAKFRAWSCSDETALATSSASVLAKLRLNKHL